MLIELRAAGDSGPTKTTPIAFPYELRHQGKTLLSILWEKGLYLLFKANVRLQNSLHKEGDKVKFIEEQVIRTPAETAAAGAWTLYVHPTDQSKWRVEASTPSAMIAKIDLCKDDGDEANFQQMKLDLRPRIKQDVPKGLLKLLVNKASIYRAAMP